MKKSIIGILVIILMICSICCVLADDSATNSKDIQSISKNGISIKFPADWGISRTTSNCSLLAISDMASIDSSGVGQININIEKKPVEGSSFDNFVNDTYKLMEKSGNYTISSSGQVAVGSYTGLMYVYTSNIDGVTKEHKAIWIDYNNEAYVILYSAPVDQFDTNLKVFDYVVHNFHIN